MTSFLRINGITVKAALDSPEIGEKDIGAEHDAIDGTPIINRRAQLKNWKFTTTPRSAAEALAFRNLIGGKGQVVSFDNQTLYAATGLSPSSIGGNWGTTTSSPKFGAAMGQWTNTNTAWPFFTSSSPWTLAWWLNQSAAGWHHYMQTSAGTKWIDGVLAPGGTMLGFVGVTAGVATFGSSTASKIDDIVALPYVVPANWPAQMYAWGNGAGLPFSALPNLTIDGLFVELNTLVTVVGKFIGGKVVKSAAAADLHKMSFELREV